MAQQELQVQRKRELEKKQESTIPSRVFLPVTDIFETAEALTVITLAIANILSTVTGHFSTG